MGSKLPDAPFVVNLIKIRHFYEIKILDDCQRFCLQRYDSCITEISNAYANELNTIISMLPYFRVFKI